MQGVQAECTLAVWCLEPQEELERLRGTDPAFCDQSASSTTGPWTVVSSMTIPHNRAVRDLSCSISSPLLSERKVAESPLPSSCPLCCSILSSKVLKAASFSRISPSMAWRIALPLTVIAVALIVAIIICLFRKRQREKNRMCLEEETVREAKMQDPEPSGSSNLPLHERQHEDLGWREDRLVYVNLSLDPDSASPKLALSEDGKSVRRLPFTQELPDNPGRFDRDPCVLGREWLSSMRYYWEVQVGRRKAWTLGVCLESLVRKGRVPKSPQHGLWALELYKNALWALAFPRIRLHPPEPLCRVGLLLDCAAGRLSFHHVADGSLVYMFTGLPFSAPLRPFFCLWTHDPQPLTICSGQEPSEALDLPRGQGQERDRDVPPMGPMFSLLQSSPAL